MKLAHRFKKDGKPYAGLTKQTTAGPQWTGRIRLVDEALVKPLSWRKPLLVFVNSMSDLFHEGVSDEFILNVFTVMAVARQHTFQVLTKRADRMQRLVSSWRADDIYTYWHGYSGGPAEIEAWPLPNVWLGVSVEDQPRADVRIPLLRSTPAAVRFVSAEPLLAPVDFYLREDGTAANEHRGGPKLDWVIVGGESGPGARSLDLAWARSIVQQCKAAGVACFVKQVGSNAVCRNDEPDTPWPGGTVPIDDDYEPRYQGETAPLVFMNRKGGDPAEWPEDLRVREFPEVRA
jgi:protein gp37